MRPLIIRPPGLALVLQISCTIYPFIVYLWHPLREQHITTNYLWFGTSLRNGGLVVVGTWTLIGVAFAFAQGDFVKFVAEWQDLQAPFLIGLGTCLILRASSCFHVDYRRR